MTIDDQDYESQPEPVAATEAEHCDQFDCPFSDLPHAN